jgi:hypothetical protein
VLAGASPVIVLEASKITAGFGGPPNWSQILSLLVAVALTAWLAVMDQRAGGVSKKSPMFLCGQSRVERITCWLT